MTEKAEAREFCVYWVNGIFFSPINKLGSSTEGLVPRTFIMWNFRENLTQVPAFENVQMLSVWWVTE